MSKCDLRIAVDRVDRRYAGGDVIAGFLRVDVNKACTCKALTIALEWRTHGRGNRASGAHQEIVLFQGEWTPGKQQEYEWFFEIPDGPVTYHGKVLNVDWYVIARADIPWAFDPKAEEEILVVPGETPWAASTFDAASLHPVTRSLVTGNLEGPAAGCIFAFLAPFALVGIAFLVAGLVGLARTAMLDDSDFQDWGAAGIKTVIGLMFAIVPGIVLTRLLRRRIAARRLGPIACEVSPARLRPGETVTCRLGFTPQAAGRLEGIEAVLIGREQVVSGSGTNQTTHTDELSRQTVVLSGPLELQPGRRVEVQGDLVIPEGAPPTFQAPSNALDWIVEARIRIPRWIDWEESTTLTVTT